MQLSYQKGTRKIIRLDNNGLCDSAPVCSFDVMAECKKYRHAEGSITKPTGRLRNGLSWRLSIRRSNRQRLLPILAEVAHVLKRLPQEVRQVAQDADDDLVFPGVVETDLLVEPVFEPFQIGQARLDGVVGEQGFVDMQIGGVQRLVGALARRHEVADLGERGGNVRAALFQRALHYCR